MNQNARKIPAELLSDEALQSITGQIFVGQGVLIAYELGLFKIVQKKAVGIDEIVNKIQLSKRATQALVSCASSLGLIECENGLYQLSELGKAYLHSSSVTYYGGVLDFLIQEADIMDYANLKEAIVSDHIHVPKEKLFQIGDGICSTQKFVHALHQKAIAPALFWTQKFSFNNCGTFIDIGGGSGVHTIAVCLNNPSIKGIICDRKGVLKHTRSYVGEYKVSDQIKLTELNMWDDPFPSGDIYFFGDIFHDWEISKCQFLAKKSYEALPEGGKIILHEMLFDDNKAQPFLTAAYNMKMIFWTRGQQLSKNEISSVLEQAGFKHITISASLGNWSLVVGHKA